MREIGNVEIPQEAFFKCFKIKMKNKLRKELKSEKINLIKKWKKPPKGNLKIKLKEEMLY